MNTYPCAELGAKHDYSSITATHTLQLPQYRKVLLQGHVALESHGLAARARLASTENVFIGL